MKKIVLSIMFCFAFIANAAIFPTTDFDGYDPNGDGTNIPTTDVITGEPGVDGADGMDYEGLGSKLRSASVALSSVELDPTREGLSVGVGLSPNRGNYAGAVGIMYGFGGETPVGVHVKAYKAEGGYDGFGAGLTVGF